MDIKDITAELENMDIEMNKVRKSYQERAKAIFKDVFRQFFDANPEVTAFGWRQYTPYFNDGDTCEFSSEASDGYGWVTNAPDPENVRWGEYQGEDDEEAIWIDDNNYGSHNDHLIPKSVQDSVGALRYALSRISYDVYLGMFGDHVQIIATRDGFDTLEYDHD